MKNDEVRAKTWTGVIPTWTAYGVPVAGEDNRVAKVNSCLHFSFFYSPSSFFFFFSSKNKGGGAKVFGFQAERG